MTCHYMTQSITFQMGSVFSEWSWRLSNYEKCPEIQKIDTRPLYNGSLQIFRTLAHTISVYGFRPLKSLDKIKSLSAEERSQLTVFCWLYLIDKGAEEQESVKIRTEFLPLTPAICGGADSGEHLDSLYFMDPGHILHIGTEDSDGLCRRAEQGERMPKRFVEYLNQWSEYKGSHLVGKKQNSFTDYTDNGFVTHVPLLNPGEQISFHYLAAEQNDGNEMNGSSSVAVDLLQSQLFEELGIAL